MWQNGAKTLEGQEWPINFEGCLMGGKGRAETIQKWSSDFEGRGRRGGN
jgi:hypothetical protein